MAKICRIFVLGHYVSLEAHSFPRPMLSENCSLLGTVFRERSSRKTVMSVDKYRNRFSRQMEAIVNITYFKNGKMC